MNKKCVKQGSNVGEKSNPPYFQRGRSIKNLLSNNNDAPSATKYGVLVRQDARIVALCALRAPPPD